MAKVTALNVAVTANTSQFDAKMAQVRAQLKQTARASSLAGASGLAGPMGGRLAGLAGLAGLSGPMLAVAAGVSALTAGIAKLQQSLDQDRQRTEKGLDAVMDGRMSPRDAARFGKLAEVIKPGSGAEDLQKLLDKLGTPGGDLATELLRIKQMSLGPEGDQLASSRFLGDSAAMFNRLRFVSDENIRKGAAAFPSTELIGMGAAAEQARQDEIASEQFMRQSAAGRLVDDILLGLQQMVTPDEDLFAKRDADRARAARHLETIARRSGGPE